MCLWPLPLGDLQKCCCCSVASVAKCCKYWLLGIKSVWDQSAAPLHRCNANCGHYVLYIINIPYGQSSAKLPVILSPRNLVIWSFSHLVTRSLGHLVTWSLGHSDITKSSFLFFNIATDRHIILGSTGLLLRQIYDDLNKTRYESREGNTLSRWYES